MSYDLDINSSIVEPDRLKWLSKIYCVRKILRKWAVTQVNWSVPDVLVSVKERRVLVLTVPMACAAE